MEIQNIKQISITDYLQQQAMRQHEYKAFTIGTTLRCAMNVHHPSKSIQSATSGTTSARANMATSSTLYALYIVALSAKPSGF